MNWIQLTTNQFLWHASRLLLLVPSASSRRKFCCWHPKNPRMKTFAQDGIVGLPSELLLRWSISKDFECRPPALIVDLVAVCTVMSPIVEIYFARKSSHSKIRTQAEHALSPVGYAWRLRFCVCVRKPLYFIFLVGPPFTELLCGESHPGRTVKATNSKSCLLCFQ